MNNGFDHLLMRDRVARRPEDEKKGPGRILMGRDGLRQWHVHRRPCITVKAVVPEILHNPHNRQTWKLLKSLRQFAGRDCCRNLVRDQRFRRGQRDTLADRILMWPELAGQRVIHNRDGGSLGNVSRRERSTTTDRRAQCSEVVRRDLTILNVWHLRQCRGYGPAIHTEVLPPSGSAQWHGRSGCRRLHTRKCRNLLRDLLDKQRDFLGTSISAGREADAPRQDVIGPKTRIHVLQP